MELTNKTVLVTGAAGFIGSHLVESLLEKGCDVHALVKYSSSGNIGNLRWLKSDSGRMKVIYGNIRDYGSVYNAMKKCDIVFHLSSLISIPYSYENPTAYFETNVNGVLNILEASRKLGIERILHTSTSEVYGSAQYVPMDEEHPTITQSPYSASKLAADKVSQSYYLSFDTPVMIVRPFNVFGPRQSTRAFIPSVIMQVLKGKEIKMGDLTPSRDLTFVKDTVQGFIALAEAENGVFGEIFNIGTNQEHKIGEVAKKIIELVNPDAKIIIEQSRIRPTKSEVTQLCADTKKIKKYTKWECNYSFEEGLVETIEWFKDNMHLLEYYSNLI